MEDGLARSQESTIKLPLSKRVLSGRAKYLQKKKKNVKIK